MNELFIIIVSLFDRRYSNIIAPFVSTLFLDTNSGVVVPHFASACWTGAGPGEYRHCRRQPLLFVCLCRNNHRCYTVSATTLYCPIDMFHAASLSTSLCRFFLLCSLVASFILSGPVTTNGGFCRGSIRDRSTTAVAGCPKSAWHHRILLSTVLFLFFYGYIYLISFPFSGTPSYYSVVSISTRTTTTTITTIRRRRRC